MFRQLKLYTTFLAGFVTVSPAYAVVDYIYPPGTWNVSDNSAGSG